MASSPRQPPKPRGWRRFRYQAAQGKGRFPWGWLAVVLLLHLSIGLLLMAFPAPVWIWYLAVGGVVLQAIALAGPKALGRFRWWSANALALVAILGAGLVAVALGVSMGFVGTANLEDVDVQSTAFEVLRVGFLAILVPAMSGIIAAETGDRLLPFSNRWRTSLLLAVICLAGLGLGAAIGLLVVE
ncbi:hypothetical protein [Leptolyngbya iicbica]|uniref:Uncharacterized protein n=2 Tax=Cyanophyceae TaxID=3028117 RepID=A0A4Q7E2R9_9CYAN|nr:hypothetical protein [Leptolyngbya sp. LK]RZM76082.1 hypothetical protein DYY88_19525 [Leptolyngbya sp. LK]